MFNNVLLIFAALLIFYSVFNLDWSFLIELMLLGLISLLLAQSARWISEICVNSSLFNSQFYICAEQDLDINEHVMIENSSSIPDQTAIPKGLNSGVFHQCGEVNALIKIQVLLSSFTA